MRIMKDIYLVGSGNFGISNMTDCNVYLVGSEESYALIDAGSGLQTEKILENTRKRVELVDKYCDEIGRKPETLRRSILFYSRHGRTILDSEETFQYVINQYKEIGINEFILYFPFFDSKHINALKTIANNVIPDLR